MKRANITCLDHTYQSCILIEDMNDLQEYIETFVNGKAKEQAKKLIDRSLIKVRRGYVPHPDDRVIDICETLSLHTGKGSIKILSELIGGRNTDMIKFVARGKKLAVNFMGGYFPIPDDAIVEILKDLKYTEKDIRISKFSGGRHYYAKIADIEVMDFEGDRKWNTPEHAKIVAKIFLNNLYKNS